MDPNFRGSQDFYQKFQKRIKFSSKNINPNSQVILSASEFNRYIELSSHQELIDISEQYGKHNCLCESRINSKMINLFFDYDSKDDPQTHSQCIQTLKSLKSKIQSIFPQLLIQFYVKDSQEPSGRINSMHIITHLSTPDGYSIYFDYSKGCSQIKHFVSKLGLQHPFDHKQAYSGHLLRLIYSNKFDKSGQLTNRILDYSALSDSVLGDDPLLSLSSYCPNQKYMLLDDYVNRNFILQYVKGHEYSKNYLFKDIIQRRDESHLSLTLTEQHTPVCEHRSNNAVCMFYNDSNNPNIIIKCQDEECGKFFQTFFRYDDNQHRCQIITTTNNSSERQDPATPRSSQRPSTSSNSSPNSKKKQYNNIQEMVFQCSLFLAFKFAHELTSIKKLGPDYIHMIGQPPSDNESLKHQLGVNPSDFYGNSQILEQNINGLITKIPFWEQITDFFKTIDKEYTEKQLQKQNIIYNTGQYVENLQLTINNYGDKTNKQDETIYDDDFNDIEFKSETHRQYFTNIVNGELQFVTEIYNLEYPNQFLYVYDDKDNGQIMFFDNLDKSKQCQTNGGFWNMQGGFKNAKSKIRDYIVELFNDVLKQFDPKDKRKKIIQYKLNQTRNDIYNNIRLDQHLSETYEHREIEFNNNPHLLHFQNGTFNLDQRKFIKTTPEMYNTFQIEYDYDEQVSYDEIYNQLSQIMYKDEFDWFLKQLSNCLNPKKVLKEKQIVVLIGFGDNGKTIVFNLMNQTLGLKAYSISGRSQMIQCPNTSSSNATPDTAGLLNKRFCYVPELDKNQPFNQQQIKILTGGEDIQARNLYKSLFTFKARVGIFISCNQLPYIDTQDGGFINRFKIIDLKYKFVDNPTHQFHKKINKDLQDEIDYNVKWRQGFMNLLLKFYYNKIYQLPTSIQSSIDQRINLQQNPINIWAKDHISYKKDGYILSDDIREIYISDTNNKIGKITFNKQLNDYIKQNIQDFPDVIFKRIDKKSDQVRGQGFENCIYQP